MLEEAKWIKSPVNSDAACLEFYRNIETDKAVDKAVLTISSAGMYTAYLNGKRIGDEWFTPYWTEYHFRTQVQTYDVKDLLEAKNELVIQCAEGWAVGVIGFCNYNHAFYDHISVIYSLHVVYEDGTECIITSDDKTRLRSSDILSSEIYNGEIIDKTAAKREFGNALLDHVETELIPQIGEKVIAQERVSAVEYIITPSGERVIDFGQNLAGYAEIKINAAPGDVVAISHAEMLDKNGNFYTANLREAKQQMKYTLSGGEEVLTPRFTWQGFRYIRLDEFPYDEVDLSAFTAVVLHSDIKRTGYFSCGNSKINQLYHNVIWGQKSNYIDIPTDCPQRDERLGWTGDAQVFVRTAAINFDVERFFKKWLGDLALGQGENGEVYCVVPHVPTTEYHPHVATAWSDAAIICPWEIYRAYGDKDILEQQFDSMEKWVEYMHSAGDEEFLWLGCQVHYGDWLAMDGEKLKGSTSDDYIASAFFAYSTSLLIKAGKVLGRDISRYEALYENIVRAIRARFMKDGVPSQRTQTAYALALHFNLCTDREKAAAELVAMIEEYGMRLTTGFVGTPYLLHALSECGRSDIAYNLLFQEKSPSWLFSVNHGATTMWEHWDGVKEDGTFWSDEMNSYNHYAYGSVYDWIFGVAAGIQVLDDGAGYSHISVRPIPDKRMGFLNAGIDSRMGRVSSNWYYKDDGVYFEIEIPQGTTAEIELPDGRKESVGGGRYLYRC